MAKWQLSSCVQDPKRPFCQATWEGYQSQCRLSSCVSVGKPERLEGPTILICSFHTEWKSWGGRRTLLPQQWGWRRLEKLPTWFPPSTRKHLFSLVFGVPNSYFLIRVSHTQLPFSRFLKIIPHLVQEEVRLLLAMCRENGTILHKKAFQDIKTLLFLSLFFFFLFSFFFLSSLE